MTDRRWLMLKLEAPLAAFGGVTIDHVGITRDFPALSMLTGLIGNALGWTRIDSAAHQALQDRLVFAARHDGEDELGVLTDTQNAKLEQNDRGWTTWGKPEGRAGATYKTPHRRLRDYHTDVFVIVALTLEPAAETPNLARIAAALDRPARPLFIGRKSCLPSAPLCMGNIAAPTAYDALAAWPAVTGNPTHLRATWPFGEGPTEDNLYAYSATDRPELIETLQACALPETLAVCDPARLEVKAMPESWNEGRRLGFEARLRPMRRLLTPCGQFPKGAEVDAFLIEGLRRFPNGRPEDEDEKPRRERIYSEWLAERLGTAARVENARLIRFQRHRAARAGRMVEGPDATIQGDLTIGDPVKFAERLAKGIGRHTAYGFGMLLIRPGGRL